MQDRPYIVGICGGSASGKTFLLDHLLQTLPESSVTIISLDNYYKPRDLQIRDEEGIINFDHPESLYLDKLVEDVRAVISGETLIQEEYTFNNPDAIPKQLVIRPAPILILEGIFVFYPPELQPLMDLKIFVEAHEYIKLARRIRRDHEERGYTIESILVDYEKYVAPMYHKFIEPTKNNCDLIIPNHEKMDMALAVIRHHLLTVLEKGGE